MNFKLSLLALTLFASFSTHAMEKKADLSPILVNAQHEMLSLLRQMRKCRGSDQAVDFAERMTTPGTLAYLRGYGDIKAYTLHKEPFVAGQPLRLDEFFPDIFEKELSLSLEAIIQEAQDVLKTEKQN